MNKLTEIRQQKAFQTPEHYFETFENRLLERIPKRETPSTANWFDRLVENLQLRFVVPATLVVILVFVVINIELEQKRNIVMDDQSITTYLLEDNSVDIEFITLELDQAEKEVKSIISDEEIVDYLHEHAMEEELIIN